MMSFHKPWTAIAFWLAVLVGQNGCKSSEQPPDDDHHSGGAILTGGSAASGGGTSQATGGSPASGGKSTGGDGNGHAGAPACDEPPIDATGCAHPPVKADCTDGWCKIPAGCFVMGAPPCEWGRARDSQNEMLVTLTHPFEIQQHELTQGQWSTLGLPNPSGSDEYAADCMEPECPVGNVSWTEALAFANLLSEKHEPPLAPCYELTACRGELGKDFACEGQSQRGDSVYECEGYRLPTKAEWEYAARAGARTAYYNGDNIHQTGDRLECILDPNLDEIAWYCFNSDGITHPSGGKAPNNWGLYDMLGNAAEWATGRDTEPVRPTKVVNYEPTIEEEGIRAALGGMVKKSPIFHRLANRYARGPNVRAPGFGFRLVRTLPE